MTAEVFNSAPQPVGLPRTSKGSPLRSELIRACSVGSSAGTRQRPRQGRCRGWIAAASSRGKSRHRICPDRSRRAGAPRKRAHRRCAARCARIGPRWSDRGRGNCWQTRPRRRAASRISGLPASRRASPPSHRCSRERPRRAHCRNAGCNRGGPRSCPRYAPRHRPAGGTPRPGNYRGRSRRIGDLVRRVGRHDGQAVLIAGAQFARVDIDDDRIDDAQRILFEDQRCLGLRRCAVVRLENDGAAGQRRLAG